MKNLFFILLVAVLTGCEKPAPTSAAGAADVAYYTCTMHPSVRSQDPHGKCPICGMDLVPVLKSTAVSPKGGENEASPRDVFVPPERQQMIGVTFARATIKPLRRTVRAVGTVAVETGRHWDYVARVEGYVHDLRVFAPGDRVEKGQVLMDLYSPELVATENEYTDLLRMRETGRRGSNAEAVRDAERLLAGARARLEQWNISDGEIDAIEKAGKAAPYLALLSPVTGLVEEVAVHQGRHVAVGDHLVDLADLSAVWVWADFYEYEAPFLRTGLPVALGGPSLPGASREGRIGLVDPFVDPMKRTVRVRIDVENPDLKLRPNAFIDVTLALDDGKGLTVPVQAVLPTGERQIVFVDKGSGRLQPRFVRIGRQYGEDYEVKAGLAEGERVVSSANFLIDAEARVQGALKSW